MTDLGTGREAAIERVKAKSDFRTHLATYIVVNALLVTIWAVTGAGYFWPIWPLAGWGVGLALNAWIAYFRHPITEDDIQREMDRSF